MAANIPGLSRYVRPGGVYPPPGWYLSKAKEPSSALTNPCGEITLGSPEACKLQELYGAGLISSRFLMTSFELADPDWFWMPPMPEPEPQDAWVDDLVLEAA